MKIALIKVNTPRPSPSPEASTSGGQNIYVANVARELTEIGPIKWMCSRVARPRAAPLISDMDGVRVIHGPAGPPMQLPKERLLPFMDRVRRVPDRVLPRRERRRMT